MKLTELRPCDACGNPLGIQFFRLKVEQHVVDVGEVRKRHAMDVLFPKAPGLAATLHGDPPDATMVVSTEDLLLCTKCFCDGPAAGAWQAAAEAAEVGDGG